MTRAHCRAVSPACVCSGGPTTALPVTNHDSNFASPHMSAAGSIAANVALFRPFIKATVDKMVQTLFADDDDIESDPTLGVLTGAEQVRPRLEFHIVSADAAHLTELGTFCVSAATQNALLDGIFTHFDADGDGKLNLSELRHFLCKNFEASAVYMPDLTVEARTAASRAKGLSEDEIAVEMKRVRSVNQQRADEIRESIDRVGDMVGGFMEMIDTDRDGFVSRSEVLCRH